ncbi:MAG: large-conductance mechanosensitive channel protein MscL [Zavarzinella sp.]|nr:large-conductance mechanosensitive channel protein MscL [Zavarzinella sp.]
MAFAERVGPVLKEGRGFLDEFRAFIRRGNVVDLAVAVIIGAAFGRIVTSVVSDILMPPIGVVVGQVDFKDLGVTLQKEQFKKDDQGNVVRDKDGKAVVERPAVVVAYGKFLQAILDFLIIAFCVFLLVRVINRLQGPKPPEEAKPPPEEVQLLREIRDLLKNPATAKLGGPE